MTQRTSLRVWFCLSIAAVAAAAAVTSWNLLRVMSAFRNAEASGLLSVGRGIAEANQPLIVALYFGVGCAVVAVVGYIRSHSYPSPHLAFSASALSLVPLAIVWAAESLMLDALPSARDGVIANATLIQRLLFLTFGSGVVLSVLFFFGWALRVSPAVAPKRTVAAVCLLVGYFVLVVIAFHLRNAWIQSLYNL